MLHRTREAQPAGHENCETLGEWVRLFPRPGDTQKSPRKSRLSPGRDEPRACTRHDARCPLPLRPAPGICRGVTNSVTGARSARCCSYATCRTSRRP